MFQNHAQFGLGTWRWPWWLRKRTGNTLVQRRSDLRVAVFQPMSGNGTFGTMSWATWQRTDAGLVLGTVTEPLTHPEQCRLCDLHETHMSWWVKVDGGAFMVVRPYRRGVSGTALPYPARTPNSDGGGSRV